MSQIIKLDKTNFSIYLIKLNGSDESRKTEIYGFDFSAGKHAADYRKAIKKLIIYTLNLVFTKDIIYTSLKYMLYPIKRYAGTPPV